MNFLSDYAKSSRDAMERHSHLMGLRRDAELFKSFREDCKMISKQILPGCCKIGHLKRQKKRSETFLDAVRLQLKTCFAVIDKFEQEYLPHFPDLVLPHILGLHHVRV